MHFRAMSYLIAGLGNIGLEYENTRHNIGFKIADALAAKHNTRFDLGRLAHVANFRSKGKSIYVIKPTTYMNLSGKAVRYWMQELKIGPDKLLVMLDDIAIPFGSLRMRLKGSDGGHNGLKDIDATLGTNVYTRLRFGVGSNFSKGRQVDYVLGQWNVEEIKQLDELIHKSCEAAEAFVYEGAERAMSRYNK